MANPAPPQRPCVPKSREQDIYAKERVSAAACLKERFLKCKFTLRSRALSHRKFRAPQLKQKKRILLPTLTSAHTPCKKE